MKKNIQSAGRIARGMMGLVMLALGYKYKSWWGLLGLFPLAEGLFGWCAFRHFCGNKGCQTKSDR